MRKIKLFDGQPSSKVPRSCEGLRKWRLRDGPTGRAQEGPLKLLDERQSLKRKENLRKILLLGIQTGDKLTKPPSHILGFAVTVACRDFILGSVATFWVMSLVGIYPGRASIEDITWPHGDTNFIFCLFYRYWWNSYIKHNFFLPILETAK